MSPTELAVIAQKWAAINPTMIATCSPRHIQSVLEDAQADISRLNQVALSTRPLLNLAERVARLNPSAGEIGAGMLASLVEDALAALASVASAPKRPAKLIRLAYSHEFYVCTCAAVDKDACTCDQDMLVTTHRNPHLVDPALVDWLRCQNVPFSIRDAFTPLGLSELAGQSKDHAFFAAIETRKELKKCGCEMSSCGFFIPPSSETLLGLHLRRPVRNQSPTEAPPLSPASLARHLEPSPALHEDHQSTAADPATDPQLPQQSA